MQASMNNSAQPTAGQAALVAALVQHLSTKGHPVHCFDTHISWVLVAGDHAYKIKKAVIMDFMDSSTLAARRHLCEEEVRLNRRLSPELYLDVVKISGDAMRPCLNGTGEAIDYAVRMHAFPQTALWCRRLADGQLSVQEVDAFADRLGRFHQQAATAPAASPWGSLEGFAASADTTMKALARLAPDSASRQTLAKLQAWDTQQRLRLAAAFAKRKSAGMVRDCHGDLHTGNILTTQRGVEVFDCIEFSEALRWIDVINDAAFAWMDLACRGRHDLATRFLNGYLTLTGDYDGLAMLFYYGMHRALVRCLVLLLRAEQTTLPHNVAAHRREALAYLSFAERLAAPGKPAVLITHGYSGSGKTSFSRQAAELLGAVHLRSDIERKRMHGLSAVDRSGAAPNSALYGANASRRTYNRLLALARIVVRAGMVVLVDAAFLSLAQRRRFARQAAESGVPFLIFDVRASRDVMAQRLVTRANAGLDASDAGLSVLAQQIAGAEPLSKEEMEQTIVVDTDAGVSPEGVAGLCTPLKAKLGLTCNAAGFRMHGCIAG